MINMAKYVINAGTSTSREVEASNYEVEGDFVHFFDVFDTSEGPVRVFSVREPTVKTIERA